MLDATTELTLCVTKIDPEEGSQVMMAFDLKKGVWGSVQARRIWNEELTSHLESEGFPATLKNPAVYVKSFRNREDFAAGKHWVRDFVRLGPGKGLDMLSKGKTSTPSMVSPVERFLSCTPRTYSHFNDRLRERERSIFFRGYRYTLRDQDTT